MQCLDNMIEDGKINQAVFHIEAAARELKTAKTAIGASKLLEALEALEIAQKATENAFFDIRAERKSERTNREIA